MLFRFKAQFWTRKFWQILQFAKIFSLQKFVLYSMYYTVCIIQYAVADMYNTVCCQLADICDLNYVVQIITL